VSAHAGSPGHFIPHRALHGKSKSKEQKDKKNIAAFRKKYRKKMPALTDTNSFPPSPGQESCGMFLPRQKEACVRACPSK
jgi:hypothetical protein